MLWMLMQANIHLLFYLQQQALSLLLSLSLCLVSSLSDGASDRMGLNLSIASSSHSSYFILLLICFPVSLMPLFFTPYSVHFCSYVIFYHHPSCSAHLHRSRSMGLAAPPMNSLLLLFWMNEWCIYKAF